ncbi:hypothetical protein NPIL_626591 [Nephila pilipes]|uniref:Uncharacterized protein n=1 Tax=Nephila pilipes TaxID=299642 RepID=A0A8X6NFZ4_NEPPI|nr:hypothetical protein NPIL_626591 [Nephila pilipes]
MATRSSILEAVETRGDVKTAIRRLKERNLRSQKALRVWPLTLIDIGVVQRWVTLRFSVKMTIASMCGRNLELRFNFDLAVELHSSKTSCIMVCKSISIDNKSSLVVMFGKTTS